MKCKISLDENISCAQLGRMDNKKVGFYCQLPKATVKEIKRRAKAASVPQWEVVARAVGGAGRKVRGAK